MNTGKTLRRRGEREKETYRVALQTYDCQDNSVVGRAPYSLRQRGPRFCPVVYIPEVDIARFVFQLTGSQILYQFCNCYVTVEVIFVTKLTTQMNK